MHTFALSTRKRCEFIDITQEVAEVVKGIKDGIVTIYTPHTTSAITINENADPAVQRDILATLERLIPHKGDYQHSEGNSDSHVKASLFGSSAQVIVQDGKLVLGTWQGIFFCEFDGPRTRKIHVYCK